MLHATLYEAKAVSGPLVFHYPTPLSSNHISNMSHPSYLPISMWSIVLLLPHPFMPSDWCHDCLLKVLMYLTPTHSTSTFPSLFLGLLWSPTTSDILISKSTINTTPFPWLAHNCHCPVLHPNHFSPFLWVYYHNYHPLSIHQYLKQKPFFPTLFKCSIYHYHNNSSHLLLCSKTNSVYPLHQHSKSLSFHISFT